MNVRQEVVLSSDGTITRNGKSVSHSQPNGYLAVNIVVEGKRKRVLAHRLLWENLVGEIPKGLQLDHIDGDRENNSLDNLRLCTPRLNQLYRKEAGVAKRHDRKAPAYRAKIGRQYLGTYPTFEEAKEIYDLAKLELIDTLETQMKKEYNL